MVELHLLVKLTLHFALDSQQLTLLFTTFLMLLNLKMSQTHVTTLEHEFKLGSSSFSRSADGTPTGITLPDFKVGSFIVRQIIFQDTAALIGPISVHFTIDGQELGAIAIVSTNILASSVSTSQNPNTRITWQKKNTIKGPLRVSLKQRGVDLVTTTGQFALVLEFTSVKSKEESKTKH